MSTENLSELIQQHLEENKDRIAKQAIEQCIDNLQNSLKWKVEELAVREMTAFYAEHVGPAIQQYLLEREDEIIAVMCSSVSSQVEIIATKLAEDMAVRMQDSWKRKQILEALLGVGR